MGIWINQSGIQATTSGDVNVRVAADTISKAEGEWGHVGMEYREEGA